MLPGLGHRTKIAKDGWRRGLPAHLAMTRELLQCLRLVPLWTYGAYLRNLRVLPPAADASTRGTSGVAHPLPGGPP